MIDIRRHALEQPVTLIAFMHVAVDLNAGRGIHQPTAFAAYELCRLRLARLKDKIDIFRTTDIAGYLFPETFVVHIHGVLQFGLTLAVFISTSAFFYGNQT